MRTRIKRGAVTLVLAALFVAPFGAARAQDVCTGAPDCTRQTQEHADLQDTEHKQHEETRQYIKDQFPDQQDWMIHVFYKYLLPALMRMANDMTSIAAHQMMIIGKFMDAKQQMENVRVIQEMEARTRKDYQPSQGVCTFGTNIRSLAASEARNEVASFALGEWAADRLAGNTNVSGAEGQEVDRRDRLAQFRKIYCFLPDNNENLNAMCTRSGPPARVNKDINYASVVEHSPTLNIDFSDTTLTPDEEDVIALASNLYGHQLSLRIPETFLQASKNQPKIADIRSIAAKRSVAEASFFTIVGLRSLGTPYAGDTVGSSEDTGHYMRTILKSLDYQNPDMNLILCGKPPDYMEANPSPCRPSYFAQMEVLTKKIYQDPAFYTNTYDTPANIERKKVSMQAIGLMQDYDTLQSYLRTEMMLSVVLETEIIKLQETVQNRIERLRPEGPQ